MELQIIQSGRDKVYVLLDQEMKLVTSVNNYLRYLHIRGKAENTLKAYALDLKVFFEYLEIHKLDYRRIDVNLIQEYIAYLKYPAGNILIIQEQSVRTPSTINRMLSTLYGFYCYEATMNNIDNPLLMKNINSPNSIFKGMLAHIRSDNYVKHSIFKVKESKYIVHLLTQNEIRQIYNNLRTERNRMIFKLLVQTGARIGEILDLQSENIPIPDGEAAVGVLKHVKSKGRYRDIYIPMPLLEELDQYILSNTFAKGEYVFVAEKKEYKGSKLTYRGIYESFKRAGSIAGIDFKFHDTRHTFITNLVESGMDISIVRIIAGHRYVTTTQQYVKLSSNYISQSLMDYWNKTSFSCDEV